MYGSLSVENLSYRSVSVDVKRSEEGKMGSVKTSVDGDMSYRVLLSINCIPKRKNSRAVQKSRNSLKNHNLNRLR
tara:strand:- start:158 stop:382 length:225 start_codon:yes stop_codon:yes gene_type:complete